MDIAALLATDGIVFKNQVSSKRQALNIIAETAAAKLGLSVEVVSSALMERENLGATGLGNGVAVPHARIVGLDHVMGIFVRLQTPVAYGAVDDRPVDLLFALFAPEKAGADHLRSLAAVSRALRQPLMRDNIRQAQNVDALRALFVQDVEMQAA